MLWILWACTASAPDDSRRPSDDTEVRTDTDEVVDTDPPDSDPPVDTEAPAGPELHMVLGIHTGEDVCSFENDSDTTSPAFLSCRDGLRSFATDIAALGVTADWQLRPGFLNLLLSDESPDRFDPTVELPAVGHAFGLHQHAECYAAVDGCNAFEIWGSTSGQTSPTYEELLVRADSMVSAASDQDVSWESFNIWGTAYRLNTESPLGQTQTLDMLLDHGLRRIITADLERAVWGASCHDGQRADEEDVWRSAPHPVTLTGSGGAQFFFLDTATTKFGDSTYDLDRTNAGLIANLDCAAERIADPEASGWNGEVFSYISLTHLHNLMEDGGLAHIEAFYSLARTEAEARGVTVVPTTIPAIVARIEAGDASGEDYRWVAP